MQCLEEINPEHGYLKGGEEEQWERMQISEGWAHRDVWSHTQGRLQQLGL